MSVANFKKSNLIILFFFTLLQKVKDARIRQEKAEEESTELNNKAKQLELELDVYGERLVKQIMAQNAKEAQVSSAEAEFNRLNRR